VSEFEMVEAAGLDAYPAVAALMTEAGDGWFGGDLAGKAARLAVAAWAMAVNGDDSTLASIADSDAAHWLMHPVWKDWAVAPGPLVTEIKIWQLDLEADPPELGVQWQFTGHRDWAAGRDGAGPGPVPPGGADQEGVFVGMLTLTFTGAGDGPAVGPGAWPWRLTSGHVSTLDDHLGWTFDSRIETAEEYRRRTGTSAGTGVLIPTDMYRLDAGFFDHDIKFGASARTEVSSDPAPTREEAEKLIWPAIWAEVHRALGEGDWRPSLASLHIIRLLGPAPPPA
jgi:hypothetical protein